MQKLVLLFIIVSVQLAHAQHSSVEESLDGYVSGNVYSNDYFDFRFKLPAGWEPAPAQTKEAVLNSLNASAPSADNRILIMLYRPIDGEPMPEIIVVFSARYSNTASNGADEAVAYFKRNRKTADLTELIAPIRTAQLGGRTIAREETRLKGQAHFMADLALVAHGHLLSFQVHTATQDRLQTVVKVLSASVRFNSQQQ